MRIYSGRVIIFIFLLIHVHAGGQQVRINEIMSSNAAALTDEDGDYSDWIELYNAGSETIQMVGWGISDNKDNPKKWTFPERTLEAGKYLLVWASGKNRRPVKGELVQGIIRDVYNSIQGTSVLSLTQHPSYPGDPSLSQKVRERFEAPADLASNYGQRMHGFIRPPATGSYTFWISSDDNGQLWLSTDGSADHAKLIAEVPSWTKPREWNKYPQQKSAPVLLEKDSMYYISALMKEGTGGDNLAVGWQLPDGNSDMPVSGQYLFCRGDELHTGFSISAQGEEILLTRPDGIKADELSPVSLTRDISYGRTPDGGTEFKYFNRPTPGKSNTSHGYNEILTAPGFSHPGGFYDNTFTLTLYPAQEGVTILYTLDGSDPDISNLSGNTYTYLNQYRQKPNTGTGPLLYRTIKSQVYTGPVQIRDKTPEPNQISKVSTTYDASPWYFPSVSIDKAVVLRARSIKEGALPSEVVSNTYFVRNQGRNPYHLPVISIMAREDALFDFYKGIYVAGTDFENWRSSNPSATADGRSAANYHREGDEWEYPAHFELFDSAGIRKLSQDVGFRIHGNWSNSSPFKSLRIYARNEYGNSVLPYPFFRTLSDSAFKRIILRNSGNDIWYTLFRDAALQQMVRHMNFETQAYQPSVLFINGEYWGIHNIRERYDSYYLARHFGVDAKKLDILENNMTIWEGGNSHYAEMMDFISRNGAVSESNYNRVETQMDVGSFIDYQIAQIFIVNTDWPGNNIKYWRSQTPGFLPEAGPGKDGRWRWMMYDTDYSFGIYTPTDYSKNMMTFATQTNGPNWPNPDWSTFLFRKLLENERFKTEFIVRFCDELNTAFLPQVVASMINGMQAAIEPEMSRHIQRWKIPSSLNDWYIHVNQMRLFAEFRPSYARNHLRQFFGLSSDYELTIEISGSGQGYVKVNTIPLKKETRGVAEDPYPWSGIYFRNVPLRLEAKPLPGYEFTGWSGLNISSTHPVLELKPDGNLNIKAIFRKSEQQVVQVPVITQPVDGTRVEQLIMLMWTAVPDAQSYEIQIADNREFFQPFLSEKNVQNTGFPVILPSKEGSYFARVRANGLSASGTWSDTISFHTGITGLKATGTHNSEVSLYPNPFTDEAFLDLVMNGQGFISIEIFSLSGNKISTLADRSLPAGFYSFRINGSSLSAGIYLVIGKTPTGTFRYNLVKH